MKIKMRKREQQKTHKIRDKNVIKQGGVKMGLEALRNMRKMQTKVIMSNISKV